jgi:hypothetical protein
MEPLDDRFTTLVWRQPSSRRRQYSLRAGEMEVGTLTFEKTFGSLATGRLAEGAWTFKRAGFLSPRVTVRKMGSESDLAVFTPRWTGAGELRFTSGDVLTWRPFGFLGAQWAFVRGDAETRLVTFGLQRGLVRFQVQDRIGAGEGREPGRGLLLLLGLYLLVLSQEDAAPIGTG